MTQAEKDIVVRILDLLVSGTQDVYKRVPPVFRVGLGDLKKNLEECRDLVERLKKGVP